MADKKPIKKKATKTVDAYTPPIFSHGMTEQQAIEYIARRIDEHRTSNKKAGWTDEDLYIRHQLILRLVTQGMLYMDIIRYLRNVWNIAESTAGDYIKMAMKYLTQMSDEYRDSVREHQIAKLERWAEECRLTGKYMEASKFTDQIAKIQGLYQDNKKVELTTDGPINVTFGE